MHDDKLTVAEAVKRWGVSERTVFRHIKQGKVKAWKVGGRTYLENIDLPEEVKVHVLAETDRQPLSLTSDVGGVDRIPWAAYRRATRTARVGLVVSILLLAVSVGAVVSLGWLWQLRTMEQSYHDRHAEAVEASLAVERERALSRSERL